jgi:putative FmdB family regulatory protein
MICLCGHQYEALQSFSTYDPDLESCPRCGKAPDRIPSAGHFHRELQRSDIPPLELQEHLEAKAYYESQEVAKKILSGELKLKEKGPKWLRPTCPEALRRKWY